MANAIQKPGYKTPAQIAEDEDALRATMRHAFLDANGNVKAEAPEDESQPEETAPQAGTVIVPMDDAKADPAAPVDAAALAAQGAKWVTLPDGTRILDRGYSLYVEGHPASPAQIQYILKVAHDRQWGKLATFKPNSNDIDPVLANALQMNGMPCCGEKEKHPSLRACQREAKAVMLALAEEQAKKAIAKAAAATPAPAPVA